MTARSQPDPGALSIAPADGYQYGDDHPWNSDKQTGLVTRLGKLLDTLTDEL
jgi:hypothetical protein